MSKRYELFKKSSMCKWFPRLKGLDVNLPETVKVNLEIKEDNMNCPAEWDIEELKGGIKELGLPVFVRTDQASHKHWMEKASKISKMDNEHIDDHIFEIISHNALALFVGRLPFECLYLREWLDIDYAFKAFLGDLKIGKEARCFINDNELLNTHYYWIEDAIKFYDNEPENWKEKLNRVKRETLEEIKEAEKQLDEIKNEFDGFWSVDFAKTEGGKWYVIDMARGEVSWHPKMGKQATTSPEEYKKLYGEA